MALVALLRGVNVGGHRTFRPSVFAQQLSKYDVINLGAAGTFVVRKPGPTPKFRAELLRRLPSDAAVVLCDGREFKRLIAENPFATEDAHPDVVRFVSVLMKPTRTRPTLPLALPSDGEWLVKVIASKGRFVFGEYRRHMKTITYLGQIDRLFGAKATTRNWKTILAIVEILNNISRGRTQVEE